MNVVNISMPALCKLLNVDKYPDIKEKNPKNKKKTKTKKKKKKKKKKKQHIFLFTPESLYVATCSDSTDPVQLYNPSLDLP